LKGGYDSAAVGKKLMMQACARLRGQPAQMIMRSATARRPDWIELFASGCQTFAQAMTRMNPGVGFILRLSQLVLFRRIAP
jgi:hypothetical protein